MKMKIPTEVMSLMGMLLGVSSLIFSGVTWKMTEAEGRHRHDMGHTQHISQNHTHKDISMLIHQNSITRAELAAGKMALKRVDKDVGALFEDLGKAYQRGKMHPKELEKSMTASVKKSSSQTLSSPKKTYEKINDNTEYIEGVYKNLNRRLTVAREIADRNSRKIKYIQKFLEDHTKNRTGD